MRFDGTVTKFDNDMRVTGFSKFDKEDIYQKTQYIPVGLVGHTNSFKFNKHTLCTIYTVIDSNVYFLECIGDPEPIEFLPADNPLFVDDIVHGNRYFPRLVKEATNLYHDDANKYTIKGRALKTTGYIEI
jgi:hypothetical protein